MLATDLLGDGTPDLVCAISYAGKLSIPMNGVLTPIPLWIEKLNDPNATFYDIAVPAGSSGSFASKCRFRRSRPRASGARTPCSTFVIITMASRTTNS